MSAVIDGLIALAVCAFFTFAGYRIGLLQAEIRRLRNPRPEEIAWHIPAQRAPHPASPHDQLLAKRPDERR